MSKKLMRAQALAVLADARARAIKNSSQDRFISYLDRQYLTGLAHAYEHAGNQFTTPLLTLMKCSNRHVAVSRDCRKQTVNV